MNMSVSFAPADREAEVNPALTVRPEAMPRLLIVDDVKDNRAVLGRRFARRGFDIVEADGGARALDLIKLQNFDTVLLDVMMPGIDGLEVLRTIREAFSPEQLPVIMVTAKAEASHVVEALKMGANDYVTKPVDFEVALARVNVQVARKRSDEKVRAFTFELQAVNDELGHRTRSLVESNRRLMDEIEQRQKSEAHSLYLALHDPLTGLPNRRHFQETLSAALACRGSDDSTSLAVLFVDLDGFKGVNDALGHSVGDLLLQSVTRDFCCALTRSDQIARIGGDEFAILLSVKDQADAAALAARLIDIAGQDRFIQGQQITIGASIGIAVDTNRVGMEELLKFADLAMYRAKTEGRGTFRIFDPAMDTYVQTRRSLEMDLRSAVQLGQLEVHYQPQVLLDSRRLIGFEALLRWCHPQRGMVSPADFIPVAEEIGLIVQIGDWVLHEACRVASRWSLSHCVAVNVSSLQFTRGNLVESVSSALRGSGLAPHRLEIEVTESVLLQKTDRNLETLNGLRSLGVRISMDDFGTGYSSLGYLRLFKFDKIKIDRSFIEGVNSNAECINIVRAILGLGKSFGIEMIAEGVETEEQVFFLQEEGCTTAQGYLFGKAMRSEDIPGFAQATAQRLPRA